MTSLIKKPIAAASLSFALSIGVGVYLCVRAAVPLLEAVAKNHAKVNPIKAEKGWDFWTIQIDNISTDLKEERAGLRKRQDELDQREARLAAEEKELARVRGDIDGLRQQIADKVTEVAADEAKNIRSLSQTFTTLSPRAAVAIFREMDDTTAVKILSQMKPDTVGAIFEEMSKTTDSDVSLARKAAVLSERLRLMKSSKPAATG
jgi:flagellar motility protein MotE (MotC chaperone)